MVLYMDVDVDGGWGCTSLRYSTTTRYFSTCDGLLDGKGGGEWTITSSSVEEMGGGPELRDGRWDGRSAFPVSAVGGESRRKEKAGFTEQDAKQPDVGTVLG